MKCLIIDAVHSSIAEELGKYMQVDTKMLPTQEELVALIPDYDVLIMRVDPAINKEILDAAKNLKVIGVCSVGLNHIDMDTAKEKGIQVIKVSDYVTIHMPLTDETKNLFNAKSIAEMKDGAVVLNMARGGIVNEKDMYEALKSGKLGGYGSDVMENELAAGGLTEGAGFDSPLFECDNFIVTPHLGAQTVDASRDIGAHIIAKVKEALSLT